MKFTVDFHFGLVLSCFGHFCFSFFYGLFQRLQEGFTGFSRAVGFVSFVFGNEANESTNKNDRYETVRTFYLNKGHRWHLLGVRFVFKCNWKTGSISFQGDYLRRTLQCLFQFYENFWYSCEFKEISWINSVILTRNTLNRNILMSALFTTDDSIIRRFCQPGSLGFIVV